MAAILNEDELYRTLPAFQPQTFNRTAPGTMAPQPADPNAPMPYGQQMRNIGGALVDGLGAAARFVFNAPGGGGLLDANRFSPTATQATTPAVTPPPTAAQMTAGGPDRVGGAQAMPAADAAPASKVATPKPRAGGAAAAPAAPQQPALVPGETGFYMGDRLVPYGTNFAMSGTGAVREIGAGGYAPAGGGGGGGLIDPRTYFQEMVNAQMRFADSAAQRILEQAGNGSQLGYSARLRALTGAYNNGLAQVGQGGANTFNSVTGQMENTRVDAATRDLTSPRALTGDLARANATLGAAKLGYDAQELESTLRDERHYTTPQIMGQQMVPGVGGIPQPLPTYGVPQRRAMPKAITETTVTGKDGDKGMATGADGKPVAVVLKNGKWVQDTGK